MNFFINDMKRALGNKRVLLSIILLTYILMRAIMLNTNFDGEVSTYEIIANAMSLSGFAPFAVVFPVMGYATSFCEEYRCGYLRMIFSRMDWRVFCFLRMITTGVSGGIIIAIPFSLVCCVGYFGGTRGMVADSFYQGTQMQYYLEYYGDWYILIGKVLLGFLFGALWALIGMALSVWFCNRYISIVAPFIIYEAMWLLLYNYRFLNPIFLIRGDSLNSYPLSGAMEIIYIVIAIFAICLGLMRRIRNE